MSQPLSVRRFPLKVPLPDSKAALLLFLGRPLWSAYRNRSRRRLFMTVFGGLGAAVSYGVGTALRLLLPPADAFVLGAITSSLIFLPLSLIIGMKMWDLFITREIRSGQPLALIRYLEEEYQQDLDRIKNLPLTAAGRARRIAEREDLFIQGRESARRELLRAYRFAVSTVARSQAGFDPRGGTFDSLAKLKSKSGGYSVILCRLGQNKVAVIEALKEVNGLADREVNEALSRLPAVIRSSAPRHEALAIFEALTAAGAYVNIIGPKGN
jgi:ribosomal protein L7/L12